MDERNRRLRPSRPPPPRKSVKIALSLALGFAFIAGTVYLGDRVSNLSTRMIGGKPSQLGPAPTLPRAERRSLAQSERDFERPRPLFDALEQKVASVEVPVYYKPEGFLVSKHGLLVAGKLADLYLAPLQSIVDRRGSVYGDDKPFLLWLEIRNADPKLVQDLATLLGAYKMFAGGPRAPVQIVLSGEEEMAKKFLQGMPLHAYRDSKGLKPDDPRSDGRWIWASFDWLEEVDWDGRLPLPESQRLKLDELVQRVKGSGRRVRFENVPATEAAWNELLLRKVDLIGTEDPQKLSNYLSAP